MSHYERDNGREIIPSEEIIEEFHLGPQVREAIQRQIDEYKAEHPEIEQQTNGYYSSASSISSSSSSSGSSTTIPIGQKKDKNVNNKAPAGAKSVAHMSDYSYEPSVYSTDSDEIETGDDFMVYFNRKQQQFQQQFIQPELATAELAPAGTSALILPLKKRPLLVDLTEDSDFGESVAESESGASEAKQSKIQEPQPGPSPKFPKKQENKTETMKVIQPPHGDINLALVNGQFNLILKVVGQEVVLQQTKTIWSGSIDSTMVCKGDQHCIGMRVDYDGDIQALQLLPCLPVHLKEGML